MYKFLLIIFILTMLFENTFAMGNRINPEQGTSFVLGNNQVRKSVETHGLTDDERKKENNQSTFAESKDINCFMEKDFSTLEKDVQRNRYSQYFYISTNNSKIGQETTTTIKTVANNNTMFWNNISEIHYANEVFYNNARNPKVIFYRNRDSSCYVVFKMKYNKHAIIFGLNERSIKVDGDLFVVYEVSEDVGSFTDNVSRIICVDKSGLYIVPAKDNSIRKIIDIVQKKSEDKFEGSVIKVSAVDGRVTLDNKPVTENNFFDNWIKERYVYEVVKGRFTEVREGERNKLSSSKPSSEEIFRNFYPPAGYRGIYSVFCKDEYPIIWLKDFTNDITSVNRFVNKRFQIAKAKNKQGCEELVLDGTFFSILYLYLNTSIYDKKVRDIVISEVKLNGEIQTYVRGSRTEPSSNLDLILRNRYLFKDLDFVKSLKSEFAKVSGNYKYNRESDVWLPFEIVRNI